MKGKGFKNEEHRHPLNAQGELLLMISTRFIRCASFAAASNACACMMVVGKEMKRGVVRSEARSAVKHMSS